ncbi:hypothetical protein [Microbacterium karelineae]|uniref:hypothetical protein n=1 Tax=Microbacterium karelineae TaxID=2654283 RepID=UPI0018D433EA|nr:hypothetical protein [Microbacterium karelineae]
MAHRRAGRGGGGAWLADGDSPPRRLALGVDEALAHTTISFAQGYAVGHGDARRDALFDALERNAKRVLRTWAPSVDWGLLASDRTGALIAYRNEPWDLVGGALIAIEAGAETYADASGDLVITGRPSTVAALRALIE